MAAWNSAALDRPARSAFALARSFFRLRPTLENLAMKCEGNRLSRRSLLTVGAVGGLGLTLADFFQLREARADLKHYDFLDAKAQSVIHIYLPGGMAHQESFDP